MGDLKLQETKDGTIIEVFVKPNSKQFKIAIDQNELVVFCKAPPEKGKANKEVIKELSKIFGIKVEIAAGVTSRQKKLLLNEITVEEVKKILSAQM